MNLAVDLSGPWGPLLEASVSPLRLSLREWNGICVNIFENMTNPPMMNSFECLLLSWVLQ